MAGGELETLEMAEVEFEVQGTDGEWFPVREVFALHDSMGEEILYSGSDKEFYLGKSNGWIRLTSSMGLEKKARVKKKRDGPELVVKGSNGTSVKIDVRGSRSTAKVARRRKKGKGKKKVYLSPPQSQETGEDNGLSEPVKTQLIKLLHQRFGHARPWRPIVEDHKGERIIIYNYPDRDKPD